MGDFQINCSESRKQTATPKTHKEQLSETVEYSHTRAASSTWPGGLRAAESIIFPEVEPAATPEEMISTNKAYITVFQNIKEE